MQQKMLWNIKASKCLMAAEVDIGCIRLWRLLSHCISCGCHCTHLHMQQRPCQATGVALFKEFVVSCSVVVGCVDY